MKDNATGLREAEFRALDELYRQGAREQPPAHLDAQIIAFAAANGTQSFISSAPKTSRRFPYVISTAASVLLLAGLLLLNPELVHQDVVSGDSSLSAPAPASASLEVTEPSMPMANKAATAKQARIPVEMKLEPQPAKDDSIQQPNTISSEVEPASLAHSDTPVSQSSEVAQAGIESAPEPQITSDGVETELQALEAALVHSGKLHDNRAQFKALLEQFVAKDYPLTDDQQARLTLLGQFAK